MISASESSVLMRDPKYTYPCAVSREPLLGCESANGARTQNTQRRLRFPMIQAQSKWIVDTTSQLETNTSERRGKRTAVPEERMLTNRHPR